MIGLVSLMGAGEGRADDRPRVLGAWVTVQTRKEVLADLFRTESMSTRFTRERRPTLIDYCGALIRLNCLCKHQLSFS